MKTYLSIAALLAAGAAFANAASVTHGDGTSVEEMMPGHYVLEDGTYSNVSISAGTDDSDVSVMVGLYTAGTVTDGVTISNASSSTVKFSLFKGSLSGKVTSAVSTEAGSVNISLYTDTSLGAGTSFELSASSTLDFGADVPGSSVTWDLSADDVANQNVLISGDGTVTFSENATIVLNFESEAALDAVVNNNVSFQLFGDGVSATGLDNASWEVQVAGADTERTLSVNEDGVVTVVPEPSAFGLLAGLGALALVASRRRRTKRA